MTDTKKLTRSTPAKPVKLQCRLERPLAERLRRAADQAGLSDSEKLRRLLDAALPAA